MRNTVNHDKVVAQALHFGEFEFHSVFILARKWSLVPVLLAKYHMASCSDYSFQSAGYQQMMIGNGRIDAAMQ
jgi:hypothetical protein